MSAPLANEIRQLKIKSGICKRSASELNMYVAEIGEEKARLERMRSEGKDESTCAQQEKVIKESENVTELVRTKLQSAVVVLEELLATSESVEGLTATEEFAQAKEILDKARLTLNPNASSTASTTDAGETSSSSS